MPRKLDQMVVEVPPTPGFYDSVIHVVASYFFSLAYVYLPLANPVLVLKHSCLMPLGRFLVSLLAF